MTVTEAPELPQELGGEIHEPQLPPELVIAEAFIVSAIEKASLHEGPQYKEALYFYTLGSEKYIKSSEIKKSDRDITREYSHEVIYDRFKEPQLYMAQVRTLKKLDGEDTPAFISRYTYRIDAKTGEIEREEAYKENGQIYGRSIMKSTNNVSPSELVTLLRSEDGDLYADVVKTVGPKPQESQHNKREQAWNETQTFENSGETFEQLVTGLLEDGRNKRSVRKTKLQDGGTVERLALVSDVDDIKDRKHVKVYVKRDVKGNVQRASLDYDSRRDGESKGSISFSLDRDANGKAQVVRRNGSETHQLVSDRDMAGSANYLSNQNWKVDSPHRKRFRFPANILRPAKALRPYRAKHGSGTRPHRQAA